MRLDSAGLRVKAKGRIHVLSKALAGPAASF
jgi:hypothetical protein